MSENKDTDTVISFPMPEKDVIQNFILQESAIRGRVVKLTDLLNDIITPHDLPTPIEHLIAQTITMTALLSSMLKYEGVFILQIQGDGPISMLVCDVNSEGHARACATYNKDKYDELLKNTPEPTLKDYWGKGYLAFTVDQGAHTDRYQGIVALEGDSLEDSVQHYFEQSEQVETVIRLGVDKIDDAWKAGAVMIQRMPLDEKNVQNEIKEKDDEDWVRSSVLLKTCSKEELLDERLDGDTLLLRLFHEEGVEILDTKAFVAQCKCSEERLIGALATMPKEDIEHIIKDGTISTTCEFCKTTYDITPPDELLR